MTRPKKPAGGAPAPPRRFAASCAANNNERVVSIPGFTRIRSAYRAAARRLVTVTHERRLDRGLARSVVVVAVLTAAMAVAGSAAAATPSFNEDAQLTGSDSPSQLGNAIAEARGTVVVGDWADNAVYIFQRPGEGWGGLLHEIAKLSCDPVTLGASCGKFGYSVAISANGNTIAVGDPYATSSRLHDGVIAVYNRPSTGWRTGQPPDLELDDFSTGEGGGADYNTQLGLAVAVAPDGSWITGIEDCMYYAPELPTQGCGRGSSQRIAVYPNRPSIGGSHGWIQPPLILLNKNTLSDTGFESMVAGPDGNLYVGAPSDYVQGAVYIWNDLAADIPPGSGVVSVPLGPDAELDPYVNTPIPLVLDQTDFGYSLATDGHVVVVGAPKLSVAGQANAGAAFVFVKPPGGWSGTAKLVSGLTAGLELTGTPARVGLLIASDPQAGAFLGTGTGLSGDAIALAAPGATVGSNAQQGEVYGYREPVGGWADSTESFTLRASNGAAGDWLGLQCADTISCAGFARAPLDRSPGAEPLALDGNNVFVGASVSGKPTYVFAVKHTLSVSLAGSATGSVSGGGIECPTVCSTAEFDGDTVTLTAAPGADATFAGWSGGGCSGTGTCTVTMNSDQSVTATFAPSTANLTVSVAGDGSVSGGGISCPGTCSAYPIGTVVTLTATAASGHTFAGWSGACSGTGACEVTIGPDQAVTATFTADPTPTVTPTGPGAGTVTGPGAGTVTGSGSACPGTCSPSYPARTVAGAAKAPSCTLMRAHRLLAPPHLKPRRDGRFVVSVKVPCPGAVDILLTAWKDNLAHTASLLQPAPGRFVYARAHATAKRAGMLQIVVTPNSAGRRLVQHHRYRVTLRLWISYTPRGGRQRDIGYYGLHLP
jgi:hypothetical protein